MKRKINMVELLGLIKEEKSIVDGLYSTYIDPDTSSTSKLFATIYNDCIHCTLSGSSIDESEKRIIKTDSFINNSLQRLQKLQIIKDEVNHAFNINIPSSPENDDEISVTVSTALMKSSKRTKDYMVNYIDRLASDYSKVLTILENKQTTTLSQDKIDIYVKAKLAALSGIPSASEKVYETLAKEYVDANRYNILDPLKIGETIQKKKRDVLSYFETIDSRIKSFNATTYIYIDLNSDTNLWEPS